MKRSGIFGAAAGSRHGRMASVFAALIWTTPTLLAQSAKSDSVQSEITQGIELLRAGKSAEAKARFDHAVHAAPLSAEAMTWRGIAENGTGEYAAAAKDLRAALRLDKSSLSAHYNLALSLIRLKEFDAAIEQLRFVVSAQPDAVQPRYNLAILLEGKGNLLQAVEELKEAHRMAPEDSGVTLHLLVDSLKIHQGDSRGQMVAMLGSTATPADVQREAGRALLESGDFAAAATLLEAARAREPGVGGVDLLLARTELGLGENAKALSRLEALPADAHDTERTYLLALGYAGLGESRRATEGFEAVAAMDPKDARPLYHLGLLAIQRNDSASSVRLLREAVRLDPQTVAYQLALARILLATNRAEDARALLTKAPADADHSGELATLLGISLAASNAIPEAIAALEKATREAPQLPLARNVLGYCHFRQGHYGEAAMSYSRAAELEPQRLLYARDAALAFDRADHPEAALRYAERSVALPGAGARDHALLGKLYAKAGRREEAIRELQQAAALDPELDAPVYLLARTYQQLGDRREAAEWSAKLNELKQRHAAAFSEQKQAQTKAIRSSALLQGGTLAEDDMAQP